MIEQYFKEKNQKFYKLIELQNTFPNWKDELNELYKLGKINKHAGLNGVIIEVI